MVDLIATKQMTAIVGLGVTGLSVARYLARENQPFMLFDTRQAPALLSVFKQEFPDTEIYLGELDSQRLLGVAQIILSPGLARASKAIVEAEAKGAEVIGDIELFVRAAKAPIIAITGSNGKTTVTTLVGGMAKAAGLQVQVGGNIGVPALDLLQEPVPDYYVLELSSFQLETTKKLNAQAAVVLNVSRDHLDRYDNFASYHSAKMRIFFGAKVMLVNRDDLLSQGPLAEGMKQVSFGLSQPDLNQFGLLEQEGQTYLARGLEPLLPVSQLKLRGRHNHSNALAAMALVDIMGGLNDASLKFLSDFTGVDHRCQWVGEHDGVTYINDSKATNVGATAAAVQGLVSELPPGGHIHILLGGQGKGAEFSELREPLKLKVANAFVYGEDAQLIVNAIATVVSTHSVSGLKEAVLAAHRAAKPGDLVLLSPACASFDGFKGYEHRGQVFVETVKGLAS